MYYGTMVLQCIQLIMAGWLIDWTCELHRMIDLPEFYLSK